jgi:hypothetical protein
MKLESMRHHALDVAQDALNGHQVLLMWIMNVKAHLLNSIGDVRAREGEVLVTRRQPIGSSLLAYPLWAKEEATRRIHEARKAQHADLE